jgi:hypothetical protein
VTSLFYRGAQVREITGQATGTVYHCEPRSFIMAEDADVPMLLRLPKSRCNCGRMFERRSPRRGLDSQ